MNEIFKVEVEKVIDQIRGKWVPELEKKIDESFEVIMDRNIITLDSLCVYMLSQEDKWTHEVFNRDFVFLEGLKARINNVMADVIAQVKSDKKDYTRVQFSFLGVGVEIDRINRKSNVLAFIGSDVRSGARDILDSTDLRDTKVVMSPEFLNSFREMFRRHVIEGEKVLNVLDMFLVGKDKNGKLTITNTLNGLVMLNQEK